MTENGYQVQKRTIWDRLGYGIRPPLRPDDDDPSLEGFAPGAIYASVGTVLSWRDRLRLLISGHFQIKIEIKTDVPVARTLSWARFSPLPPHRGDLP